MNENIYNQAYQLRRKVAEKSLLSFAKLFTPHYLTQPPSKRHLELYDLALRMLSERGRRVALAAPRQFGKTTLFTNIYLPYCVCYGKEQFIVIVSHTASQAIQILDNLKRELTGNVGFQETFPEIFESEGAPKPPRWTQNCIVTRNGIQILALGYGQQIRGRKHGPYRPSLVILDDLEASENMFSVETKEKMKSWLNKSVLRVGTSQTNYLFLGNVLNSFSLLGEIIKEGKASGWDTTIRYQAIEQWPKHMHLWQVCWRIYTEQELYRGTSGPAGALQYYQDNKPSMDEGARTLWPEHWSLFQLMMEYFQNEIAFLSEMQNTPPDASDLALDVEGFHYWNDRFSSLEALLEFLSKDGQCFFGGCDPAMGKDAVRGDNSAIVIVGYKDKVYYILEADICHRNPDRLITDILAYCERYKFRKFAIEANGFQELIRRRLQDRAFELGIRTEFVPIDNYKVDKISRIQSLYPWTKNGYIQFNRNHKVLLDECRQFPGGKHPDGLDALEMAIRIAVENRSNMVNKDFMNLLKRQKLLNLYPVQLSIEEQLKRVMRGDWGDALGGCLAKI